MRPILSFGLLLACLSATPTLAPAQGLSDEVFYHFMPIAWRDSNDDASRFGDFGGMTASLDYLDALGITAVWMNPIHPSPAYHGYQHGRGDQLNVWFGPEADFITFVQAAHARGIKVYLDFVAYGISQNSLWFNDAYANPASPYDDWLAFENAANTDYLGSFYSTWNGDGVGFIHWDLRDSNPVQLVTQWAQKWLDPNADGQFDDGVDGYRLDHVWETYPNGPDGYGYHIDTFWAPWRDALRSVNPDVLVFAEQANWGSHGAELLVGMDAAFTKPFEFAARDALSSETSAALRGQMRATIAALNNAPASGTFLCTIGNHDVGRLASEIGSSFAKGRVAAAVLMTQPYTPIIYYGDEIGMMGVKDPGHGSDAADIPMREPFKWNAVAGPPMTNYFVLNPSAYNNRISQNNDGRSVEEQDGVSGSLLEAYRDLIATRKASVALRQGGYTEVGNVEGAVWSFVRDDVAQQVLVLINLSGSTVNDTLDLSNFDVAGGATTPNDLLTGVTWADITDANKGSYAATLGPYQYVILEADLTPQPEPVNSVNGATIPVDFFHQRYATQDTPTALGDDVGELDEMFLRTEGNDLFVGLTGNLVPDAWGICLLLDSQTGGQNLLDLSNTSPPPAGPADLTGTQLDAGFAPDHMLFVNTFGGTMYVDQYELLTAGGVNKTYRGSGIVGSGSGFLSGGFNPLGMEIALDNANTAGVTDVDASGAGTAEFGMELKIPLADIGVTSTPATLRLAAFILLPDGTVSNQWLPSVGGQSSNLGIQPDLTSVPGQQWLEVGLPVVAVAAEPVVSSQTTISFANPAQSIARFDLSLARAGSVRVTVYDVRGRRVSTLLDDDLARGEHSVVWDGRDVGGRKASAGVYFVQVRESGSVLTRRLVYLD